MTSLTASQMDGLRRLGSAVEELSQRNETAGRSISAIREQRRRLSERASQIDTQLRDPSWQVRSCLERGRAQIAPDPADAAKLRKLEQDRLSLTQQIASADRSLKETHAARTRLVNYLGPLSGTWDALLRYTRMSPADFGIASGVDVPRSFRADVTLQEWSP